MGNAIGFIDSDDEIRTSHFHVPVPIPKVDFATVESCVIIENNCSINEG
jgi:hypothetical protein